MSKHQTLARAGLAAIVKDQVRIPADEAARAVENILKHMCRTLGQGEEVTIIHFGSFRIHRKAARPGRNPKTGEHVTIAPRQALTFRGCDELRARLNRRVVG